MLITFNHSAGQVLIKSMDCDNLYITPYLRQMGEPPKIPTQIMNS
jgi:hypothetical protein